MTGGQDLLRSAATDGRELVAVAATGWTRPIPHCPGWDAAELVGHLGGIFSWMFQIVSTGQPVDRKEREIAPESLDERAAWYLGHLDRTVKVLSDATTETTTWTFSSRGVRNVGWWRRRIAVETAIHRWDMQYAASQAGGGDPAPLDANVATAGIEEFLLEFLPGMLAYQQPAGLTGMLHLHAVDRTVEWSIDLNAGADAAIAVAGDTTTDTALRGSSSDLLLFLTNREPSTELAVFGDAMSSTNGVSSGVERGALAKRCDVEETSVSA